VIGSGGDPHLLKLDLWGTPEQAIPLDSEVDGANMYKFIVHGLYGTTGAAIMAINVTTDFSAV
jgi:hypothetical protein